MSNLPLSAFPMAGKASQSSVFVIAVLIGLALFIAAKNKQAITTQKGKNNA